MIEYVKGNILNAKEQLIYHQCNCVSFGASGLAKAIFNKFPYSNIYSRRRDGHHPGNIIICGDGIEQRFIVNAFGQYNVGYPNEKETKEQREDWFKQTLKKVSAIKGLNSIAFPYKVGCGLAGGDWNNYLKMIEDFDFNVGEEVKVVIYNYEL